MTPVLAPIRDVLEIDDVCDLLRISKPTFYELKQRGWFDRVKLSETQSGLLQEVLPRMSESTIRYQGGPFVLWLSDRRQRAELEKALAVSA